MQMENKKPKRLLKKWWPHILQAADREGLNGDSAFTGKVVADEFIGVEEYLHEVAHAAATGRSFRSGFSSRIGAHFDNLNSLEPKLGLMYELQALAVETKMLSALGCSHYVQMPAMVRVIWKYGQSGPTLPWTLSLQIYRQFLRAETTLRFSRDGIAFIWEVIRREDKRKNRTYAP